MDYESKFKTRDGLELYERGWAPDEDVVGRVVFVHGYGEHCSRYEEMARVLNESGFSIHTYDQRGFGHSPGRRGEVGDFGALVEDLDAFVAYLRPRLEGKPWFLMGHSMGGLVLAHYAETREVEAGGLVFSSPFLAMDAPAVLLKVSGVLAALMPWMPVAQVEYEGRSRDPEAVKEAREDPLIFAGPVRARTGAEFNRAVNAARAGFSKISLPVYIIHGGADRIVPDVGSRMLYAQCSAADKSLKIYDDGYHELWNDLEKAAVLSEVCEWLTAHAREE